MYFSFKLDNRFGSSGVLMWPQIEKFSAEFCIKLTFNPTSANNRGQEAPTIDIQRPSGLLWDVYYAVLNVLMDF